MKKRGKMFAIVSRLVVYSILVYGMARYFEWKNVFHPSRTIRFDPSHVDLEYEDIYLVTEDDKRLHGWWIPHEDARGSLIFFHGNAGNIGDRIWMAKDLHELNLNIFLLSYRGYGKSRGIPTEKGTYKDARAAYEFVRVQHDNADNPPIVLYGRSLGGAIAIQCALDKPVRGLMIESAFKSIPEIGRDLFPWLPVQLIARYSYDNVEKISHIDAPVLIAASHDDAIVPWEHTRAVYEAATEPKYWAEMVGGHNETGWHTSPKYWSQIQDFLDEHLPLYQ